MRTEIIAEAGINHNGNWTVALDLVDAAFDAGADAVKFQIYHADKMIKGDKSVLQKYQLTPEAHKAVAAHAREIGIEWLASVFDQEALETAVECHARRIKVGSGEITNLPLLADIGRSGLPLILSTGMSVIDDVFEAVAAYQGAGGNKLTLLHCVSNYPTMHDQCNLKAIDTLKRNFFCPVGFSDHTTSFDAAVAAVAFGAQMIERHFYTVPDCPDKAVSLSKEELKGYVATIRRTEAMMGDGDRTELQAGEQEMQKKCRGRWYDDASLRG